MAKPCVPSPKSTCCTHRGRRVVIDRVGDEVEDLLKAIEEEIRKRRRAFAVRLEIEAESQAEVKQFLMQALDLESNDV